MTIHIYDWLDIKEKELETLPIEEQKVWEFLDFRTRDAAFQYEPANMDKILGLKVYCMYNGAKCRITGASRLGDVWLREATEEVIAIDNITGYTKRVDIADCSEFSYTDTRNEVKSDA